MNAELLYTSAPQGLKQGSRGFCTVVSTVGMPLNLATKLESLSGYRHLYPSGAPDASKNPVSFSHLRFMVGGRQISVLSRISDYGLDYSQRTNKLAHHIVVDAPMPACGPATVLAEPGVMRDHWDGQCANKPSPPALPNLSSEPQVCRKWEAITGDAGWGGVVASAWLSTSPRPVFIIFAEHQSHELLGLMEESIALLPPNKRWQATFGTYVTTLPPDVECRVRCVVAGSDEARMAKARGTVIDFTINLGQPSIDNAVQAARNGLIIGRISQTNTAIYNSDIEENKIAAENILIKESDDEYILDADFNLEPPLGALLPPAPPKVTKNKRHSEEISTHPKTSSRMQYTRIPILLAGVVALLFTCLVIVVLSKRKDNFASITNELDATSEHSSNNAGSLAPDNSKQLSSLKPFPRNDVSASTLNEGNDHGDNSSAVENEQQLATSSENPEITPSSSSRRKISFSKIQLIPSGLMLNVIQKDGEERILKLLSAIPGSRLEAILRYDSDSQEDIDTFEAFIKGDGNLKWTWLFSTNNGNDWTEQAVGNSSFIEIATADQPSTRYKLQLGFGDFEGFDGQSEKKSLEVFFKEIICNKGVIQIDINNLIKQGDGLSLKPSFPAFLPEHFDVGFLPINSSGKRQNRHSYEISYRDLISVAKSSGAELEFFAMWDSVLKGVQKLNSDRDRLKDAFDKTSRHFRKLCADSGEIHEKLAREKDIFIWGKMLLKENGEGVISDISFQSDWSAEPLRRWFEFMQSQKKQDLSNLQAGQRSLPLINNFAVDSFQMHWIEAGKSNPEYGKLLLDVLKKNADVVGSLTSMQDRTYEFPVPLSGIGIFENAAGKKRFLSDCSLWFSLKVLPFQSKFTSPTVNPFLGPYANAPPMSSTSTQGIRP
jgi:hypothetical protein